MRLNEYNSLEEFTTQYIGEWNPSEGHWFGLDFRFKCHEYRLHTGTMYGDKDIVDSNGVIRQFGIYVKTNKPDPRYPNIRLFNLLGEYSTIEDVLNSTVIEGMKFSEVIMDDNTELLGQD